MDDTITRWAEEQLRAENTRRVYRAYLRRLAAYFHYTSDQAAPWKTPTKRILRAFRQWDTAEGPSPQTYNGAISAWRNFLGWAEQHGLRHVDRLWRKELAHRTGEIVPVVPTDREWERHWEALQGLPRDPDYARIERVVWWLLSIAGLHVLEICHMQAGDVEPDSGHILRRSGCYAPVRKTILERVWHDLVDLASIRDEHEPIWDWERRRLRRTIVDVADAVGSQWRTPSDWHHYAQARMVRRYGAARARMFLGMARGAHLIRYTMR